MQNSAKVPISVITRIFQSTERNAKHCKMVKKVAKKNGDLIFTLRHLQDIVMRILKTCSECGKSFVASKMTNKYCSRQCANVVKRRNESIRKGKLKEESKSEEQNVKIQELYLKPFLTPKEVSVLLGVCLTTVYRYFYSGTIKAVRIHQRTFIRREDLDKFFEDSSSYRKRNNQKADKNEYYTLREIMEKPLAFDPRGRVALTPSGEIVLTLLGEIKMTPPARALMGSK